MTALTFSGSAIAVAIMLLTALNLRQLRRPGAGPAVVEAVSILVPARNEERHIRQTVESLLAQSGLGDFELLVLDDGSTDSTAAILNSMTDPRLRVISAPDELPPAGWLGKSWACARLAEAARGTVLVFADADVAFAQDAVQRAVLELRRGGFALVSPFPRQLAGTTLERLTQPLVTWLWLATMPVRWSERSLRPSLSAANGQFLVADAAGYRQLGGHGAVRSAVLEDMALMRAFKRAGQRTATLDGTGLAECRMYRSGAEVVAGYTKSLWSSFGSAAGSLAGHLFLFTAFIWPPVAALAGGSPTVRWAGLAGFLAGVASRLLTGRRMGQRLLPDSLLHPLSILLFLILSIESWRRHLVGRNSWKGRPV